MLNSLSSSGTIHRPESEDRIWKQTANTKAVTISVSLSSLCNYCTSTTTTVELGQKEELITVLTSQEFLPFFLFNTLPTGQRLLYPDIQYKLPPFTIYVPLFPSPPSSLMCEISNWRVKLSIELFCKANRIKIRLTKDNNYSPRVFLSMPATAHAACIQVDSNEILKCNQYAVFMWTCQEHLWDICKGTSYCKLENRLNFWRIGC